MAKRMPSFFPQRVNQRVSSKTYTAGIEGSGLVYAHLGAPAALNNTGILAAQSINTALDTTTFAATFTQSEAQMGRFGRCLRIILSGAGTPTVVVYGRDYLGQRMSETFTGNGAAQVLGLKAFRYIDRITSTLVAATTLDVGWRDCFGVPWKFISIGQETKDGILAANAGTFVAGLATGTAATATNADVRGTYLVSTVLPDGVRTLELRYYADHNNLDGNAQYTA